MNKLFIALLLFFTVCALPTYANALCAPGDHSIELRGWPGRPYEIHIPSSHDCSKPLPVVLALHGGGMNSQMMRYLLCPSRDLKNPDCMDGISNRERFIVVYPNGTSFPAYPVARAWNDGSLANCPCEKADDIKFFLDLLNDLRLRFGIDSNRVYSIGMSNGGGMSHKLACDLSTQIAAIAAVGGANQAEILGGCKPQRPVSIMQIHGTWDQWWPYFGGITVAQHKGYMVNVPTTTIYKWAARNGCNKTPVRDFIQKRVTDGTQIVRDRFQSCASNESVVLYSVLRGGHVWPGPGRKSSSKFGLVNHDIIASQEIWNFLRDHSLFK